MLKSFWKAITWAIVILVLSGIPGSSLDKVSFWEIIYLDKIMHMFMYFILTLLLISGFKKQLNTRNEKIQPCFYSVIIGIFYGGIVELLQEFIFPERSAELFDFISNSFGTILACFTFPFAEKIINKLKSM